MAKQEKKYTDAQMAEAREWLIKRAIHRRNQPRQAEIFKRAWSNYEALKKQGRTKDAERVLKGASAYAFDWGPHDTYSNKLNDPKVSKEEKEDIKSRLVEEQVPFELSTTIQVDGKKYSSFADYKNAKNKAAAEKKQQMKIDEAKRVLEKFKGATPETLKKQIAESKRNLETHTKGGSYQTRFEAAFRDFLHERKMTAAEQTAKLRATAAGTPEGVAPPGGGGDSLVTYDAYGRPVDPGILNLSQYYGKLSKKDISALALDHAKRKAAFRTAQLQYNKENPHLVGRDVPSMLRTEFRESAAGQAVRQDYMRDKEAARTIQQNIANQTTALNAYNTLTSAGYQYDKDKGWTLSSNNGGVAPQVAKNPQDDKNKTGVV